MSELFNPANLPSMSTVQQESNGPLIKTSRNNTCYDALNLFTNCTDTNAFRRINEGNAESSQPTMLTHVPTHAHSPDNLTP